MANPTCRNCDRSADAGAYCSSCAAGILSSALNPTSAADGRNFHQGNGHFHGDQYPRPATHPVNTPVPVVPSLALRGVPI